MRAQRVPYDVAEDVVQTTWLRLVHRADAIHDPAAVLAWLVTTAKRESWRVVRDARRTQPLPDEQTRRAARRVTADGPEASVLAGLDGRVLWQHVRPCPSGASALLRVVAFSDRPDYATVAQALGMPIGSIGPTRGRCLAKLRHLLDTDPHWGDLMTDDLTPSPREQELAVGALDTVDLDTLGHLRALWEQTDPVPAGLTERVRFAISLGDLEAEVARLQREGVPELVARGDARLDDAQRARTVTFTSDSVTTMVTISESGGEGSGAGTVRIDGWSSPGAGLRVELRTGSDSRESVADDHGRFVLDGVPHGMAQLVLRPAEGTGGPTVVTPAIEL